MIEILESINIEDILDEYNRLESSIQWTDHGYQGKQVGLQYKRNDDPWTSSVGKSKGLEFLYSNLNPFFKETIFETIIQKFKLFRTRLMWVNPFCCYSMHKDHTLRIHIPIITNPECYLVFKNTTPQHISVGNVYLVNTKEEHTFINCSNQSRLHLVGLIKD